MNDIFEFRRFGALALKYYRENMKLGIFFLAVVGILTFLSLCRFNPFLIEYSRVANAEETANFLLQNERFYNRLFWIFLVLFAFVVSLYSFREFVVKEKVLNTLLLPASTFEKYLLAFLNSTVVVFVVYLLLFYALATVVNSYKYVGMDRLEYVEGGFFRNSQPAESPGQRIVRPEIRNVFRFNEKRNLISLSIGQRHVQYGKLSDGWIFNLWLIEFLCILSVGMWGSVTFRKHPFILTFLVHVVFFAVLAIISVWLGNKMFGGGPAVPHDSLSFYGGEVFPQLPSEWWLMLLYVFPVAYQYVIWMKLKTKQIQ